MSRPSHRGRRLRPAAGGAERGAIPPRREALRHQIEEGKARKLRHGHRQRGVRVRGRGARSAQGTAHIWTFFYPCHCPNHATYKYYRPLLSQPIPLPQSGCHVCSSCPRCTAPSTRSFARGTRSAGDCGGAGISLGCGTCTSPPTGSPGRNGGTPVRIGRCTPTERSQTCTSSGTSWQTKPVPT